MLKRLLLCLVFVAAALCVGFYITFREPRPASQDGVPNKVSNDLDADIKLMWETETLRVSESDPTHGPNPKASTERAIDAAERVFNTLALEGQTAQEVIHLLGDPVTSSDSDYNFPFYSTKGKALVYRFDTGSYGWQFNLILDEAGKVKEVKRLGIE